MLKDGRDARTYEQLARRAPRGVLQGLLERGALRVRYFPLRRGWQDWRGNSAVGSAKSGAASDAAINRKRIIYFKSAGRASGCRAPIRCAVPIPTAPPHTPR